MKHCLLRRLLGLVPLLLGISFLSFVLIQLSPGDPAEVAIRVNDITPTPELLAEMRAQLGLDRPFPERYLRWLADVLRGDLGTSYVNGRPVAGELARALPPTLMLAGSFVVECIFAWPGLGRLCVTAIFNRDLPVIQAYVLLMAVLFVAGNLCMDICASLLDPRLRERGLR